MTAPRAWEMAATAGEEPPAERLQRLVDDLCLAAQIASGTSRRMRFVVKDHPYMPPLVVARRLADSFYLSPNRDAWDGELFALEAAIAEIEAEPRRRAKRSYRAALTKAYRWLLARLGLR